MATGPRPDGSGELVERLPGEVLQEILAMLDVVSLCSAASVSRAFCCSVYHILFSVRSHDLSGFSPTADALHSILDGNEVLKSLTLDCAQLDDSSIEIFAKEHLQELVLLKCVSFSSYIFIALGEKCPKLRLLTIEMPYLYGGRSKYDISRKSITRMLAGCPSLEFLCIKYPSSQCPFMVEAEAWQLFDSELFKVGLPRSIRDLALQPISEEQAKQLFLMIGPDRNMCMTSIGDINTLNLVLEFITDELLVGITGNLHHLVKLCLKDIPIEEPSPGNDLTSLGLQALSSCKDLQSLSLTRSKRYCSTSFKRVNDLDMIVLAEGCRRLESITLSGFSKVSDAGYASILHFCRNLQKIKIVNGVCLSDLTFHNLAEVSCVLVEVRLISCDLLTSNTAEYLSSCSSLEVLSISGCRSITDDGLYSILELCKLTELDLSMADITDNGLAALTEATSPIASLSLRGCKRVSSKGLGMLFNKNEIICKTLLTLDMSFLPSVSDQIISIVMERCNKITDLSIRSCFYVTDASVAILGLTRGFGSPRRSLRRLDVFKCIGLTSDSFRLFAPPHFRGLWWLGFARTKVSSKARGVYDNLLRGRPLLVICNFGCELGCKDGWRTHGEKYRMGL